MLPPSTPYRKRNLTAVTARPFKTCPHICIAPIYTDLEPVRLNTVSKPSRHRCLKLDFPVKIFRNVVIVSFKIPKPNSKSKCSARKSIPSHKRESEKTVLLASQTRGNLHIRPRELKLCIQRNVKPRFRDVIELYCPQQVIVSPARLARCETVILFERPLHSYFQNSLQSI